MSILKETRMKLGLSQQEMAELLGYAGQKDISRIETKAKETERLKKHLKLLLQVRDTQ